MSTEQNKAIASTFFERFSADDIQGALNTMTDDATWWIPGKNERSPAAGLYSKEKIGRLFGRMVSALKNGLRMKVVSCIAEADRVAVEVTSSGDLKNGRPVSTGVPHAPDVQGRKDLLGQGVPRHTACERRVVGAAF